MSGRRIVVAGGGIGGVEAALTLAAGLPQDEVTLVGRWPSLRVNPGLVYVPFGVSPRHIDLPLQELATFDVQFLQGEVSSVDAARRTLVLDAGEVPFDVLVASPGAISRAGTALRTLDDALRLQRDLQSIAATGARSTITIHAGGEDAWTAPAAEFAILLGAWRRALDLTQVEVLVETSDREVFEWFGPEASDTVNDALERLGVKAATGVPEGRHELLAGDLSVNFGALEPRAIDGLPGLVREGWYVTDERCAVDRDIFVIGDATSLPFRAGFATAWQARRVLTALGGKLDLLGPDVDGIPVDQVEYQMDLADAVMRARVGSAESLGHPFLGHDADVEVVAGGRPDKLVGLLTHARLMQQLEPARLDAPLAFRQRLVELSDARGDRA